MYLNTNHIHTNSYEVVRAMTSVTWSVSQGCTEFRQPLHPNI